MSKSENKNNKKKQSRTTDNTNDEDEIINLNFEIPIAKILLVCGVIFGIFTYYVVKVIRTPPPLPEVNMDQYWGTYPMDQVNDLSIRPFKIEFSDEIVQDLKERLLHHRKPPLPLENSGSNYGFNSNCLTQITNYWRNSYNFKERENFLNQYEHFVTKIQGLDIHFMHVKPKTDSSYEVVPLLMLHGWPGSIREFYEIIPKLTEPHDDTKFVFEVIAPSLPGFGFSQGASRTGLGPMEMAVIVQNLMKRLGHERYYVQGGDLGHSVGSILATLFPDSVLGFHTNMPTAMFNPIANLLVWLGSLWPSMIEDSDLQGRMYPLSSRMAFILEETGYFHIQATKPDTVGAALSDSPAGLAAYILEKFSTWTNPDYKKAYDGKLLERYSLTQLLDNVMIYWITNSITTSMRVYAETINSRNILTTFDRIPTEVPTCGIKFKHELFYQPDSVIRLKYTNYLQTTVVDDGGHFAALEKPEILANDIYAAVTTIRNFHGISSSKPSETPEKPATVYDFTVKDINGNTVKLDKYRGKVLLIVNVASQCGLTETNYKELNELHEKYYEKGLRILAFPCNQFNSQEPGSSQEILAFIKQKNVKFDIFEKIEVNGEGTHPLWQFLKGKLSGTLGEFVKWNFSKFVIDRKGNPVERFGPNVNPLEVEPILMTYL